jgi:hypothetical protein
MDQAGEDAREILLTLYRENSGQARHYEQQRQAIAAAGALVAGVVLGLLAARERPVGHDPIVMLQGLLLAVVGATGFVASLTRHERARLHVERVHAVRREISRRFPVDIQALYDEARRTHAKRYPRMSERTGRVHWAYQALHASIAGLGVALALLVLAGAA